MPTQRLRICLLTYRGNPRSGGQGIYIRNLSRELAAAGHIVDVWSGPPYPELDPGPTLVKVPSLDLWNEDHFFRAERLRDLLDPIHRSEWLHTMTGAFPEPRTFCERVLVRYRALPAAEHYDIIHDNQSLGHALLPLVKIAPVVSTIHHPVTVDRRLGMEAATTWRKRFGLWRWYNFLPMQVAVARQLERIVTVSESAAADIAEEFGISRERMSIVPVGVDIDTFRPLPRIERCTDRIITTVSADTPLKGFTYLLDAFVALHRKRPSLNLTVIGARNEKSKTLKRIAELNLNGAIRVTGRLSTEDIVTEYARSTIAVVPSLYEGFGLPAAEAMACRVPLVSTNAGALPEVVGANGAAGVLVPPADSASLGRAIASLLDTPERRLAMGMAGRERVQALFTWSRTAERSVKVYRDVMRARARSAC